MDFKLYSDVGIKHYTSFLKAPQSLKVKGAKLFHKRIGFCTLVVNGKKTSILVKPENAKPQWVAKSSTGVLVLNAGVL